MKPKPAGNYLFLNNYHPRTLNFYIFLPPETLSRTHQGGGFAGILGQGFKSLLSLITQVANHESPYFVKCKHTYIDKQTSIYACVLFLSCLSYYSGRCVTCCCCVVVAGVTKQNKQTIKQKKRKNCNLYNKHDSLQWNEWQSARINQRLNYSTFVSRLAHGPFQQVKHRVTMHVFFIFYSGIYHSKYDDENLQWYVKNANICDLSDCCL